MRPTDFIPSKDCEMMSSTTSTKQYTPISKHKTILQGLSTEWQKPLSKNTIAQLKQATEAGAWDIWMKHLVSRKRFSSLSQLLGTSTSPLIWSANTSLQRDETLCFIEQLTDHAHSEKKVAASKELLNEWATTHTTNVLDATVAIQNLACAWSLAELSNAIGADLWWAILDQLVNSATDTLQLDIQQQPLAANLLGGELPLVLAYLFPELKSTSELSNQAIDFLSEAVVEMLDGEGMPKACYLPFFGPLLGCWTRCRAIMEQQNKLLWNDAAENQYRWLITQAVRMSRGGGGFAFAMSENLKSDRDLLISAVALSGNKSDRQAARAIVGRKKQRAKRSIAFDPSYHSEWAGVGLLRSKFSKKSRQLGVTYENGENRLELSHGNQILFSGEISTQTLLNGKTINQPTPTDWEQVAWESNADVDYLEIEKDIGEQTKIQRSFLLSRSDHFLVIADAIFCNQDSALQHRIELPLGEGVTVDSQEDTWELMLKSPNALARILPLGLAEWRTGCRNGKLGVKRRLISLEQTGYARAFVPLFIDLSPKRAGRQITWRQLAIGENRQNMPFNVAAGFRVQVGQKQWLIYRSLDRVIPRTVLGQNLLCEYHVSRFQSTGIAKPLLEVQ
ncbi:MAG: hypothetical protein CBB70_13285 [Planctomycetaceae bacterium TMED10]|nr:MAG: hypothetical protein CBB70_13285 [Planctomycetaceae bacterium TMED10]